VAVHVDGLMAEERVAEDGHVLAERREHGQEVREEGRVLGHGGFGRGLDVTEAFRERYRVSGGVSLEDSTGALLSLTSDPMAIPIGRDPNPINIGNGHTI